MQNQLPALHLTLAGNGLRIRAGKMRKKDEPFFELLFVGRRDGWWQRDTTAEEAASFELASRLDTIINSIMRQGPWPATTTEVELVVSEDVMNLLLSGESTTDSHLVVAGETRILPPRTKHLHKVKFMLEALLAKPTLEAARAECDRFGTKGSAVWLLAPLPKPEPIQQQPGVEHFTGPPGDNPLESFAHYGIRNGLDDSYWTIERPDRTTIDLWKGQRGFCVTYNGIREGVLDQFVDIPAEDLYFVIDNLVAGKRATVSDRFPSQVDVTYGETLTAA